MNLGLLKMKVRSHARDFNNTIFREDDITLFVNEGIDRAIQVMPQLQNVPYVMVDDDIIQIIPREYTHLFATYAIARLMSQDERHYEGTTFMNEFEIKLAEFKERVDNGEIELLDPETGVLLESSIPVDYVVNEYFHPIRSTEEVVEEEEVVTPPPEDGSEEDEVGNDDEVPNEDNDDDDDEGGVE